MVDKKKELTDRLRSWYENGRFGMKTVCSEENSLENIKEAVRNWFEKGYGRFDAIIKELEKL